MNEFVPIQHFYYIVRLWWVVVLAVFLGGAAGYLAHLLRPPVYEATAIFYVTIDFNKVEGNPLSQYDEDLALSVMQQVLYYSPEIQEEIISSPEFEQAGLTNESWINSIIIEREHAFWKIRVRHTDPEIAQTLVNKWANLGYQTLVTRQDEGKIPDYVTLKPPLLAELPQKPTNFGMNSLMLAGSLIGFLLGSLVSDWLAWRLYGSKEPG